MSQPHIHKGGVQEGIMRHTVLNTLRSYRQKFSEQYGELVICCDSRRNWRKKYYVQYKAHRSKDRQQSDFNWDSLFQSLNKVKEELIDFFPYHVLQVPYAEADDIIGALSEYLTSDPILIVSGDKDFQQLQKYENVSQWSPLKKEFVVQSDPERYLKEHIMRGDKGDGVPNFLSEDDTFTEGGRQVPITKKKIVEWVDLEPSIFCDYNMMKGYTRNRTLVDLSYIPDPLKDDIIELFNDYELKDRSKLLDYFINNQLKNLMEHIGEF
tara:strand:- start:161 stop:961 length:801 start_codon:yes stop_codon:yes gene_type:complete